ncbi:MAG: tRNA dihydrouridine synthase DusB [Firmicutes bacterium]|nr:tRNA dihydrouridine synthase DusB [Bacillota bacterium]
MLKIGSVVLKNRVISAPMAGVTDRPFRRIIGAYGPGLICSEMVSSMALHYNSRRTKEFLAIDPEGPRPLSVQILGADPGIMAGAARAVEAHGADLLDINMGCPAPKVVKNGEGAALLNNLPLARAIIAAVVSQVRIPVTVKFRLGWDHSRIVAVELAQIAEECGAAAVILHARTRDQFYQGRADWEQIAKVKASVTIPVIGNGDVDSPQAAVAMFRQTGCDGVMVGQGILGRPWLTGQIIGYLDNGVLKPDPDLAERMGIMLRHMEEQIAFSGEDRGLREMRKHFAWYLKGFPGSAGMRELLNHLTSVESVLEALQNFAARLGLNQKTLFGIANEREYKGMT